MKKIILFFTVFTFWATILHAEVPIKESVTKLYVATFNRAPDAAGLNYWLYDSGLQLEQIAQSFFDQPETQTLYPVSTPTRDFIEAVYRNLFNRLPDTGGWDYWESELESGRVPKSVFLLAVINGAQADDAVILENKQEIGLYFSESGLNDTLKAKDVMEGVDVSQQSVEDAKKMIDTFLLSDAFDIKGTVQLGYIAGATVSLFDLDDLSTPIRTTQTSESMSLSSAGTFIMEQLFLDEEKYYLVTVSGGKDIDINDDGEIDTSTQTDLNGTIFTLVNGKELKNDIRVNVLGDMIYTKIENILLTLSFSETKSMLNEEAGKYLFDINGDSIVNYEDVMLFNPVFDKDKMRYSYRNILNIYVDCIHKGKTKQERMSARLSIDRANIIIENGIMQEVPFFLNARLENLSEGLDIKWFLDGKETMLGQKINVPRSYMLSAKIYQGDQLLSVVSQNFSAIHTREILSINAISNEDSIVYITQESNSSLAGTKVIIPKGALDKNITIKIKESSSKNIVDVSKQVISDILVMEPSGTIFNVPVIIRLPYVIEPKEDLVLIARYSENGIVDYLRPIRIDRVNKEIVFETEHFSAFQAIKYTFSKSADEKLVQFLNDKLDETYSVEDWEPVLNTVISEYDDQGQTVKLRVYDFAMTLFENYQINGFVNDHEYIAALRVLFPSDDSTGSKAVARWNEVKGGLALIGGLMSFDITKPILSFMGLVGLPNDVSSTLEILDFPIYNPVSIGGDVIAKLDEGTRNGQINEFWAYLSDVDFVVNEDPNSLGHELMQNLAVIYNRNRKFNYTESLSTLKEMIEDAKQNIEDKNNPYTLINHIQPIDVYAGGNVHIPVDLNTYGYDNFDPHITIYDIDTGLKIDANIEIMLQDTENQYSLNIDFTAPVKTGRYTYQFVYKFSNERIVEQFSVEVKNKTQVEFIDYVIDGEFFNGGSYRFIVNPVFKSNKEIDYSTIIRIPNLGVFSNSVEVSKEQIETLDLSNVSITFIPKVESDRSAEETSFVFNLSERISDELSNLNYIYRLTFYKWNEKYFETGHDNIVASYQGNTLTINKGDSVSFWIPHTDDTVVYYDLDGDEKPNSHVNTLSELHFGTEKTFYIQTYNTVGLFTPSVLFKDRISGKEYSVNSYKIRVVDLNNEVQNVKPAIEPFQFESILSNTATTIYLNAIDPNGDMLSTEIITEPLHGMITGTGTTLTYTPDKDYTGLDSFVYSVKDGNGGVSEDATVNITIIEVKPAEIRWVGYSENEPKDSCLRYDESGCEETIERGETFVKEWQFKNIGNVDYSGLQVIAVSSESEFIISAIQLTDDSLPVNDTVSYKFEVSVPENARIGIHKALFKLVDVKGDLFYSNGEQVYFWYKFKIEEDTDTVPTVPQNFKATQTSEGVLLSWDPIEGATSYTTYAFTSNGTNFTLDDVPGSHFVTDTSYLFYYSLSDGDIIFFSLQTDQSELSEKIQFVWQNIENNNQTSINDLIFGTIDYRNDIGEQLDIPSDMWVRIVPSANQNDTYGWDGLICKVNSSGGFGQECYVFDETRIRELFANSNETYQIVVFKNHVDPEAHSWNCGEDVYQSAGMQEYGSWSTIAVMTANYQSRANEVCSDNSDENTGSDPEALFYPNGGEVWLKDEVYTIRWDSSKITGGYGVNIYYINQDVTDYDAYTNFNDLWADKNTDWHLLSRRAVSENSFEVTSNDFDLTFGNSFAVLVASDEGRWDISNGRVTFNLESVGEPNYQNQLISGKITDYGLFGIANYIRITPPEGQVEGIWGGIMCRVNNDDTFGDECVLHDLISVENFANAKSYEISIYTDITDNWRGTPDTFITGYTEEVSDIKNIDVNFSAESNVAGPDLTLPVTGLHASDGTYYNKIEITWDGMSGVTAGANYELYRCADTTIESCTLITRRTNTSYTEEKTDGIQANTNYYYRIRVQGIGDEVGEFSHYDIGYLDPVQPIVTEPIASQGTYGDRVHISWVHVEGASAYTVYACNTYRVFTENVLSSSECRSVVSQTAHEGDTGLIYTEADDTDVIPGVKYWYHVRARKNGTYGEFSKSSNSGYAGLNNPLIPAISIASVTTLGDTTPTFSIRLMPPGAHGAQYYKVYRCSTEQTDSCILIQDVLPYIDVYDNRIDYNANYYYRARSVSYNGNISDFSEYAVGFKAK